MTECGFPIQLPRKLGQCFLGIRRLYFLDLWAGHGPARDETSFSVGCRVDSIIRFVVATFLRSSVAFPFWPVPLAEWTKRTVDWLCEARSDWRLVCGCL